MPISRDMPTSHDAVRPPSAADEPQAAAAPNLQVADGANGIGPTAGTGAERAINVAADAGIGHDIGHRIDIVLPCLDEAGALPWVLARIPVGARAIVVDNGSTDGSPDIARSLGATVVTADRRGYGAACDAGLRTATADIVAFCDCDASLDPGEVVRLAAPVIDATVDLAMGRRRPVGRSAWPLAARLANRELARRIRRRTGRTITDLGPLRVARREALLSLDVRDRRSGYPLEVLLRAADAGWRITEFDVQYFPRVGKSKVTGTPLGAWRAVRDMSAVLAA